MKAYKTPLILLSVIVVLGLVAYWDEWKTKEEQKNESQLNRLFSGEVAHVNKFVIEKNLQDEDALVIEMEKRGNDWFITSPISSLADSSMVQTTLQSLLNYRYERKLEGDSFNLADFGLDSPQYQVRLEFDEAKSQELAIGNNLPVGYSTYVQLDGAQQILIASQSIATSLNKSLYDFRSKKFPIPSPSQLKMVEYQNQKGEKIILSKVSGEWMMNEPDEIKADQDEVEELIREVRQTTIKEFLDNPSPAIQNALSLENRGTELLGSLRFTGDSESLNTSLLFLKNGDDLYARWEGQGNLHRVEQKLEGLFQKSVWDFRYKDVFSFDSNQVEKLVIDGKSYEKRSHNWYREDEPDSPKYYDHVRRFLIDLEYVKAKDLLDAEAFQKRKLSEADHHIIMQLPENVEVKAQIWRLEKEEAVIIKKSDDPTYYLVGSDILDDVAEKLEPNSTGEEGSQES
ncbi:MAG: DUF4340 domain-containing protein [Oligoflexus sp.]